MVLCSGSLLARFQQEVGTLGRDYAKLRYQCIDMFSTRYIEQGIAHGDLGRRFACGHYPVGVALFKGDETIDNGLFRELVAAQGDEHPNTGFMAQFREGGCSNL